MIIIIMKIKYTIITLIVNHHNKTSNSNSNSSAAAINITGSSGGR